MKIMGTNKTESYCLHRLRRQAAFTPEHLHSDIKQQVRSLHDVLSETVSYPDPEELKPGSGGVWVWLWSWGKGAIQAVVI